MKYRSLFVSSLLILSSLLSFDAAAQTEEGWRPPQQTVERLSKNQPEFNYYEEKVPSYTLPEVLTTTGGRKVTSPRLWNKVRREEILELFRGNVYGRVPSTPYTKSFKVVNEDKNAMGGASLARRCYGETVARINNSFPHWFCGNYKKYGNNEDAMPVDMHMLISLIAPRAVYVTSASEDLWADPRGSYLSLYHSVPVFQLLKTATDLPFEMPPLNRQVIRGKLACHVREGAHNMLLKDWNWFMDFGDVVLK